MNEQESAWIIEGTTQGFEDDVVGRSMTVPVVVDFWSEDCGPCRQLMPLLEKLAVEYDGRFVLVKVNVAECPEIAGAFGVQSIPFVVAISQGQPVEHFMGFRPEDQLRQWLSLFLPNPAEEAFREGEVLEATDVAAATLKFREAVEMEPEEPRYLIAMARVALGSGAEQECREIVERLEARGFLEPEAERLKEQLELLQDVEESGGLQEARAAATAAPDDLSVQLALANALAAEKQFAEACDICLAVVEKDKYGDQGTQAKESMVRILDLMGRGSELASQYRRRLATAFY